MKKLATIAIALVVLATMLVATPVYADTGVVGNPPIDRKSSDTWSNFVIGLTSEVFAKAATVSSWEVYVKNEGDLGLLLLRPKSGSTYKIIGSDIETARAGLNQFTFTPDLGGTAKVKAGDILGLYIGSAKVDFDDGTDDTVGWCARNNCITNANAQLAAGKTITINQEKRRYSVSAKWLDLGPLTDLKGTWYGKGWNVIAIPIKRESGTETNCEIQDNGKESFCIHTEPYCEILDISKSIEVDNKLFPENIVVPGLAYDQKVFASQSWKPGDAPPKCPRDFSSDPDFKQIHGEKGNWLFLETERKTQKIARIFSLGRGVMALAMGKGESTKNLQAIERTGGFPVAELGTDRERYNSPYTILDSNLGNFFNLDNPNEVLDKELIKGKATILKVSTDNSGGAIASIPFFDTPNDLEGAFQVPSFKSTFWIENIKDPDNLQLQYSQTTDLDFRKDDSGNLVLWPHVDVATLCKDNYCQE